MQLYDYQSGNTPLLISMPHAGSFIPEAIAEKMSDEGKASSDTDWHVDRLYEFAKGMQVYWLRANYSRYVIDLNRSADDKSLYPDRNTTELCPTTTFAEQPVYMHNQTPDRSEINDRLMQYWQPYHQQLAQSIYEIQQRFGYAVLLEAHSIAAHVPRFFEGQLTDFNFGTNAGTSCSVDLVAKLKRLNFEPFSVVYDGVFKGGYITRAFGKPDVNIHALQLEISQAAYLPEDTTAWSEDSASDCIKSLNELVQTLLLFKPD